MRARTLHPVPLRVMHWANAIAIFLMVGSGWKIYDDEIIFSWLYIPDWLTIGRWAQHGLQVHFFGMWIFVVNGLAYLVYGFATGRFRRMLLPLRWSEVVATISDGLHFRLGHEDTTRCNAVQKLLYLGVVAVGILAMLSGLAIWKPVQFSEPVAFLGGFQAARVVHFLCMAAIVAFVVVHVTLALLVPKTIRGMLDGGPVVDDRPIPG